MNQIISKELLSAVLGQEVEINCKDLDGKALQLYSSGKIWWMNKEWVSSMNIHELAHKCKEWAMKQGIVLEIMLKNYCQIKIWYTEITIVEADTEPEAIFKAAQWILDNVKDKS